MDKVKRIEKYLYDFFSTRFERIDIFYRTTHRDRHTGVYQLKDGTKIMDLIITIHSMIEDLYYGKQLIPQKFPTPDSLFASLTGFKKYLLENQKLLDQNNKGANVFYVVTDTLEIQSEIVQMIDYAKQIYDRDDALVPYQELRYKLITRNIPDFINILKSILSSVSYAITKIQEGYFHSNVHLILRLLGFEVIAEESTNIGRIDAVIRFTDTIYIIEFKFDSEKDLSDEALGQIKEKDYASKFLVENKDIIAIGVSFSKATRNINGYKFEIL